MDDVILLKLQQLEGQILSLEQRVADIPEDMDVPVAEAPPPKHKFPFQVYVLPGATNKVCVRSGVHLWWNQMTGALATTTLSETGTNSWAVAASTIYVKRVANSDGTATVTLERTTAAAATVLAGQTNTEARFVLAEIGTSGGITQWHTGGAITEYRVA